MSNLDIPCAVFVLAGGKYSQRVSYQHQSTMLGIFQARLKILNNHGLGQGVRSLHEGLSFIDCHSGISGMTIAVPIGVLISDIKIWNRICPPVS